MKGGTMKSRMRGLPRPLWALPLACAAPASAGQQPDLCRQLLDLAGRQQTERRAHFAAATSKEALEALQRSLREKFLKSFGGLPRGQGVPPAKVLGTIEAGDYVIEKLVFESSPGYYVPGCSTEL
jgi:hypothetical protein